MRHTLIDMKGAGPVVDRRTTLRWFATAMAAAPLAACGESPGGFTWTPPEPLTGPGYGGDPDLLEPSVPWPLTLTRAELAALTAMVDLILPADDNALAASAVGVPAFLDEWVSAPYPAQQRDRALIVPGLAWLDSESMARNNGAVFASAGDAAQRAILDDIAWRDRVKPGAEQAAEFFARVRSLTMGAYFTSDDGWKYLGYLGNTPGAGDYPGPTPEALAHLEGVLNSMGLEMPT